MSAVIVGAYQIALSNQVSTIQFGDEIIMQSTSRPDQGVSYSTVADMFDFTGCENNLDFHYWENLSKRMGVMEHSNINSSPYPPKIIFRKLSRFDIGEYLDRPSSLSIILPGPTRNYSAMGNKAHKSYIDPLSHET